MPVLEVAGCEIQTDIIPDRFFFKPENEILNFIKNLDQEGIVFCIECNTCVKVFFNRNIECRGDFLQRLNKAYQKTPKEKFFDTISNIYQSLAELVN